MFIGPVATLARKRLLAVIISRLGLVTLYWQASRGCHIVSRSCFSEDYPKPSGLALTYHKTVSTGLSDRDERGQSPRSGLTAHERTQARFVGLKILRTNSPSHTSRPASNAKSLNRHCSLPQIKPVAIDRQ